MSHAISLRQMEYIVAVADRGGFRRAAAACHVSQPSMSAQIALVERLLGVRIFERDRRTVRLSPQGAVLVAHARRVLVAAAELHDATRRLADPFAGTIRLGVIPTIGPYLLPDITPALARSLPNLSIAWSENRTPQLLRDLHSGELDGVLIALEASIGDVEHIVLGRDPFVLAASPTHPLVQSTRPARVDALAHASVLLLDDGHCFRDQTLLVCGQAGAREQSFRATSLGTLAQMVSASQSVTLLPSLAVPVENRRSQLRVRRFVAPGPSRTLALAWRRGSAVEKTLRGVAATIAPLVRAGKHSERKVEREERRSNDRRAG